MLSRLQVLCYSFLFTVEQYNKNGASFSCVDSRRERLVEIVQLLDRDSDTVMRLPLRRRKHLDVWRTTPTKDINMEDAIQTVRYMIKMEDKLLPKTHPAKFEATPPVLLSMLRPAAPPTHLFNLLSVMGSLDTSTSSTSTTTALSYAERAHLEFSYDNVLIESPAMFVRHAGHVHCARFSFELMLRENSTFRALDIPRSIFVFHAENGTIGLELINDNKSIACACGDNLHVIYEMLWQRFFERQHCSRCLATTLYDSEEEKVSPHTLYKVLDTTYFSAYNVEERAFEHRQLSRVLLHDGDVDVCSDCFKHSWNRTGDDGTSFSCAICQCETPYAGQLSKCGHSFCRLCLHRHWMEWNGFSETPTDGNSKTPARCPVCRDWFHMSDLVEHQPQGVVLAHTNKDNGDAEHKCMIVDNDIKIKPEAGLHEDLDRRHRQRCLEERSMWQQHRPIQHQLDIDLLTASPNARDDFDPLAINDNLAVDMMQLSDDRDVMSIQQWLLESILQQREIDQVYNNENNNH